MIENILKQIVDLDEKKPDQNNDYFNDEFKSIKRLLIDAERVIDFVDNINGYISYFNLNNKLLTNYNKFDSYEKPTNDEVCDLINKVSASLEKLSNLSSEDVLDVEINNISSNIEILNSYIKSLRDEMSAIEEAEVKKYNKKRNELLAELKSQIDNKKKEEELHRKEFLEFYNSIDFSENFILFKSNHDGNEENLAKKVGFEMPEITKFGIHNFSNKDGHNLLFIKDRIKDNISVSVFEDLFFRLLFHFDANLLQVQPIGILPLKLNAVLSYCKTGEYFPIKPAILDEKNFENYLSYVYNEVTFRINKYKDYKNFYKYNKAHQNNPDKAIIIFLNDYPQITNKVCNVHIKNLLNSDCYLYGVYFIVSTIITTETNKNDSDNKVSTGLLNVNFASEEYQFKTFYINNEKIYLDKNEVSFDLYDETAKELFLNKFLN